MRLVMLEPGLRQPVTFAVLEINPGAILHGDLAHAADECQTLRSVIHRPHLLEQAIVVRVVVVRGIRRWPAIWPIQQKNKIFRVGIVCHPAIVHQLELAGIHPILEDGIPPGP